MKVLTRRLGALGLVILAGLTAPSPVEAGTLRINTAELPCRDPATASEIARRIADLMATQPNLTLEIRALPKDTLELTLTGPGGSTRRELEFHPGDCPAIAQTVSLLLRGWIGRRWQHPAPQEAAHEGPLESHDRVAVTAEPNDAIASATPPPPTELGRLALLAGAETLGPSTSHAGPALRAAAEWDARPALGLSLLLGLDVPSAATPGRGSIAVKIWDVALAGRWSPWRSERNRLELLAGAGVDVAAATANGYGVDRSDSVPLASFLLGARWRARLGSAFSVLAGAELALRSREHRFAVRNLNDGFTVSASSFRLLVGLAWESISAPAATPAPPAATAENAPGSDGPGATSGAILLVGGKNSRPSCD